MKAEPTITTADRLAALGEVLRLRLIAVLESAELSVGEVARVVQLPQSTVSRHLKALAEAGWVVRRAEGPATYYRVSMDELGPESRDIWAAVRAHAVDATQLAEDARRIGAVLAERRTDSVTFFGRVGGEWDQVRAQLFGGQFTCEALLGLIPRNWVVADIGCGTGNAAEVLAQRVEQVIAIDQSTGMLDAAKRRLDGATNVRFVEGQVESLPLKDATVDAATCLLVLHHVEKPELALREMRRVMRTSRGGGVALVVDMQRHTREEYHRTMGHKHLGFDADTLAELAKTAGLNLARYDALTPHPDSLGPGLFAARLELLE